MSESHTHHKLGTLVLALVAVLSNFSQFIPAKAESNPPPVETALVAPANDNLANAQIISGLNGSAAGTTVGASKEGGEPAHARNRGGASVWYKYVVPGNGVLTVNTTGSGFDTTLAVYQGMGLNDLHLLAANDDSGGSTSAVTLGTTLNETLYIAVDGFYNLNTHSLGSGTVNLNFSLANAASNDNFGNALLLPTGAGRLLSSSNVGASKESGEPGPYSNNGGKSLWFKWVAPSGAVKTYTFTIDSVDVSGLGHVKTIWAMFAGSTFANMTYKGNGLVTGRVEFTFRPTPGQTYYLMVDGWDSGTGAQTGTFNLSWGIARDRKTADFDQDGRADISVYRPLTGAWYTIDSITDQLRTHQFGVNGDRPFIGDFGSDGVPDYAVFRADTGTWYFDESESGFAAEPWGMAGDVPYVYNYDNKIGFGVFRGTTGMMCEKPLGSYGACYPFGLAGDIPLFMDRQGFGRDGAGVFRPSNGTWYWGYFADLREVVQFGQNGDKPVPADYDADGKPDIAVFRPSTGTWYINYSASNSVEGIQWGMNGDIPQPADYDGDGRADIAVFRSGVWYIRQSNTLTLRAVQFGQAGDIPVTSPVR